MNKKNPIAKILNDRRYRQVVVKNKKVYNRKRSNYGQFKNTNPKIINPESSINILYQKYFPGYVNSGKLLELFANNKNLTFADNIMSILIKLPNFIPSTPILAKYLMMGDWKRFLNLLWKHFSFNNLNADFF